MQVTDLQPEREADQVARRDPLAPTQLGGALLAAQPLQQVADLLLRGICLRVLRRIPFTAGGCIVSFFRLIVFIQPHCAGYRVQTVADVSPSDQVAPPLSVAPLPAAMLPMLPRLVGAGSCCEAS